MGKTLLIGDPARSWRDWLKENRGKSDLLVLDPNDPSMGVPARFHLFRGAKPIWSRFYGSLDPLRSPHVALAALAEALSRAGENLIVEGFAYRGAPALRQTVALIAQLLKPDRILVPEGLEIDLNGFPIGPEGIELSAAFPRMVQQAQRKAQWMKMLEACQPQEVNLRQVSIEGARLGSGTRIPPSEFTRLGIEQALHAEKMGSTLFLVAEEEFEESQVARALDATGTAKAAFSEPQSYANLLCSFARESGEDIGFGIVRSIDFRSNVAECLCTSIPPAPVRILRLGTQRVDPGGTELGELRPWQV